MGAWRLDCEFVTYPPWVASSETSGEVFGGSIVAKQLPLIWEGADDASALPPEFLPEERFSRPGPPTLQT